MEKKQLTDEEMDIVKNQIRFMEERLPSGFGNSVSHQGVFVLENFLSREMTEEIRFYFRHKGWVIPRARRCEKGWSFAILGRYPTPS